MGTQRFSDGIEDRKKENENCSLYKAGTWKT